MRVYTTKEIRETKDTEVLKWVLMRGKDDGFSWAAASNPSCPPEVLTEVLRRGNDNWVTCDAASNPNCPLEALSEVLKRGKNDEVSKHAAMNMNCPYEESFKWLEKMGKLTKYDPEIHELEHNGEDRDLEELRKLLD